MASTQKKLKWHYAYHPQECYYSLHSMPSHPQDPGDYVFDEKFVGKELALQNVKLACAAPEMLEILKYLNIRGGVGHDIHESIREIIKAAE